MKTRIIYKCNILKLSYNLGSSSCIPRQYKEKLYHTLIKLVNSMHLSLVVSGIALLFKPRQELVVYEEGGLKEPFHSKQVNTWFITCKLTSILWKSIYYNHIDIWWRCRMLNPSALQTYKLRGIYLQPIKLHENKLPPEFVK